MTKRPLLAVLVICLVSTGCGYVAEHTAPTKQPSTSRSAAAVSADELFWNTLHGGQYDHIAPALDAETGAYLADPGDAVSAAHVAWLHIWRLSESGRMSSVPATITDDAVLAQKYFAEAVGLNSHDARYLGFLASTMLVEGSIQHDERETRRGYFLLLDAIKAWPEFNLFTAGYVMSAQPAGSERFRQALEWQWQTLDACAREKVKRDGEYAKYMPLATDKGPKRVCWNSWIAPHNFEGFFLNMGDMVVKSGDWRLARRLYDNAKLSPTYSEWKFRQVLEDRIRDAPDNVGVFNDASRDVNNQSANGRNIARLMISSSFSCVACHEQ